MVFNKEMIDLLQLLRKRFREENLGVLQLSSPNVLDEMVSMATRSTCNITKDLTYAAIQLADISLSREDLDPPSFGYPDEGQNYRTYRGQKIVKDDKPKRAGNENGSGKVRMYRGQVVAS
ncbi:hypothetical protein BTA51_06135 [Hahella sp. CCB-MM4]|uniref:hypothetical protein n=1 Tax=Hahella sp. (strain CCB-MM4) TaxID=1926491 RepID=UPI000B9A204F|nr:hypothetical protein [Hahella sp. CCB-MM4]OZG74574.1 hypothetical protein BTA51_06135 [Hahella sp. CCB-MM4]